MDASLNKQYLATLNDKIRDVKGLLRNFQNSEPGSEALLRAFAHTLHGSGRSFGYPQISELANTAEHAPADSLVSAINALVKELRRVVVEAEAGISAVPAVQPPVVAEKPDPQKSGMLRKVLVIEDDPGCNALVRQSLAAIDPTIEIVCTASAADAQHFLVSDNFSLIVLDLILPDGDGREILREIKIDFRLQVPVAVLSGITQDIVRVECMSLGAAKFLTKPIDADELGEELKKLLATANKPALTLVPKGSELEQPEADSQADRKGRLADKTILVAEDDPMQAILIQQRLADEGLKVEVAKNGRHALQLLRQQRYALVILDVQMPMVTGFDVLECIRGELELPALPVIILSAMGGEADIIRGYDLGANDYILKPFSPVQLVARVKSLLKRKPA